jgi:hypothetical protein
MTNMGSIAKTASENMVTPMKVYAVAHICEGVMHSASGTASHKARIGRHSSSWVTSEAINKPNCRAMITHTVARAIGDTVNDISRKPTDMRANMEVQSATTKTMKLFMPMEFF